MKINLRFKSYNLLRKKNAAFEFSGEVYFKKKRIYFSSDYIIHLYEMPSQIIVCIVKIHFPSKNTFDFWQFFLYYILTNFTLAYTTPHFKNASRGIIIKYQKKT